MRACERAMGPSDADLQRRRAELTARERAVAARERELEARRSLQRIWWALRLAPWGVAELVIAGWAIVAAALLGAEALRVSCCVFGVLIGALALLRLGGATMPRDPPGS